MSREYTVTSKDTKTSPHKDRTFKGETITYSFDFSPWAEDNSTITTVTWTVDAGQASVSGQALSSNVATANIATSECGRSLIEISATDGTRTKNVYLDILTTDPYRHQDDYGFCGC